jgi:polysaccharide lyase-like protein
MLRSTLPSFSLAFRFASTRQLALIAAALGVALACSDDSDTNGSSGGTAAGGTAPGTAGTGGAGTAGASAGGPGSGGDAGSPAQAGSGGVSAAGAAGTGSAAVAICPEGAVFCDDFEQAALGAVSAPWRESTNMATVAVDEVQAFNGTKAVHVNAPQAGTYHRGYFALDQGSYPGAAQEMYGRAMMYLPVLPNADVHWTFIQGEGVAAPSPDVATHNALYRYGGQHQNGAQLMANYETTNMVPTDCWDHSASVLPTAKWTCVEWHFKVATNEMQFWLEGNELSDIHVIDRGEGCGGDALGGQWLAPPAFETLYLGWEHYQQTQNPIDLWVDAVVVDTKRVGCPAEPQ